MITNYIIIRMSSKTISKFKIVNRILKNNIFDDNINSMILKFYWKLLNGKHKVLLDWIDINNLCWKALSSNKNAISLLEKNIDKIDWEQLSSNTNAISLLEKNIDKIDWRLLSCNKNAISLLEKHIDKIVWKGVSFNKNGMKLLLQNYDKIEFSYLEGSLSMDDLLTLENENNKWYSLYDNKKAIEILEKTDIEQFDICYLSCHKNAVPFLEKRKDKIDWDELSFNTNAICLLKDNIDKINWINFSKNPKIFEDIPMPKII